MNVWTRKSADDPYCANCSLTWDMHIAGSNACPMRSWTSSTERPMTKLGETCKHGGLRRSCETCDLAEQLDAALLKLEHCESELRGARMTLAAVVISNGGELYLRRGWLERIKPTDEIVRNDFPDGGTTFYLRSPEPPR